MVYIQELIPKKFKEDSKLYRSIFSIVLIDVILLFVSIVLVPIFLAIGFTYGAYIMFYTSIAAAIYILLLNKTQNLDLCGDYFTFQSLFVSLLLMYYTGGIVSPFLFWLFSIAPVSFLYFKVPKATKWAYVVGFCFITFATLQIFGYEFEQHLTNQLFLIIWTFNFSFTSFIFISSFRNFQKGIRRVNSKLMATNDKLKNTNDDLERFAYIASHDLKSPVRGIISFTSLFEKKYMKDVDPQGQEFIQLISSNAHQMHNLIEDILEYSKSNSREIKKVQVDLNIVLNQIKTNIHAENSYPNSKILFNNLPLISSDFVLIKQLLQNLIENGLKYNNSLNKIIAIQYLEKKDQLYFIIKDNGIGMEEQYLDRIFEMFQRLHNKNEYQGTGIGLAICKKIIQQLEGNIWVTSKINEGSTFHISFPKSILIEPKDLIIEEIPIQEESLV